MNEVDVFSASRAHVMQQVVQPQGDNMKKQILSISPFQTAKVMALLSLIISLPFVLLMAASFSVAPGPKPPLAGMMIFVPVVYMLFGFIFTLIGAWIYNLVAKWVGGIEFTVSENGKA